MSTEDRPARVRGVHRRPRDPSSADAEGRQRRRRLRPARAVRLRTRSTDRRVLEGFAFWGLAYLDAQSWRHYLPRLIDYALRRPDDPAMVAEALVRSLRPPDRYPPRLASLSNRAGSGRHGVSRTGRARRGRRPTCARMRSRHWTSGGCLTPRSRPTHDQIAAARQAPAAWRMRDGGAVPPRHPRDTRRQRRA